MHERRKNACFDTYRLDFISAFGTGLVLGAARSERGREARFLRLQGRGGVGEIVMRCGYP